MSNTRVDSRIDGRQVRREPNRWALRVSNLHAKIRHLRRRLTTISVEKAAKELDARCAELRVLQEQAITEDLPIDKFMRLLSDIQADLLAIEEALRWQQQAPWVKALNLCIGALNLLTKILNLGELLTKVQPARGEMLLLSYLDEE